MASSFSDLSIASSQSASSALSRVSESMSRCSLAEQTQRNEEALLECGKDFLSSQRTRIVSECDALQVLPFLSYALQEQNAREQVKHTHRNRDGRAEAVDMLLDLVLRLRSLPLVRQFLVTIVKRNPRFYLEGTAGWNSLPEFKKLVPERIYYLGMLLSDVPADHPAWKIVFAELEECANNPLLKFDWMTLALLNEFNEQEMSDHGITSMATFWNYWLTSRRQPTLSDLLTSLFKMGLHALVECLGLEIFQLSNQEVSNLICATDRVPDVRRFRGGVPQPRAGPLPDNSTMLHNEPERVKTFSAIAAKMAGRQDLIMRSLAFDMDRMEELREEYRGKSRACSEAMLNAWYSDTLEFEPLVEHLLFALKQAGRGALAADVKDTYPQCHAARSAYKDKQRR